MIRRLVSLNLFRHPPTSPDHRISIPQLQSCIPTLPHRQHARSSKLSPSARFKVCLGSEVKFGGAAVEADIIEAEVEAVEGEALE